MVKHGLTQTTPHDIAHGPCVSDAEDHGEIPVGSPNIGGGRLKSVIFFTNISLYLRNSATYFVQSCSRWEDFNWHSAPGGPSEIAEAWTSCWFTCH